MDAKLLITLVSISEIARAPINGLKSLRTDVEPDVKSVAKHTGCWRGDGRYNSSRTGIPLEKSNCSRTP
jgi:hypothetical protein